MSRPNVLILMGDQHPYTYLGCYGHRSVKTPNLDALAEKGWVSDAAYCASPICAPDRAAMMTGRHTSVIETWDNSSAFRSDWPTFAHSFRKEGYRTILCGKMHFVGPDQHHGFEERWVQDIYPADFRWTRLSRDEGYYNDGQNIDVVLKAGPGRTYDMDYDDEVVHQAVHGIRRMKNHSFPFMMCVSFTNPHHPYNAPEEYYNLYSDEDVDLPEVPEDYEEGEHEYIKWIRKHGDFHRLVPDEVIIRARRAYLARVTMLDEYVGKVIEELKSQGLYDDTIIIYTSDHGDQLGEHGLWFKNTSYEWSSRIPLIVSGPGISTGRSEEPFGTIDFYKTLPGLAGIEPAYPVSDGIDRADLIQGKREDDEEGYTVFENYGEGMWRGMRTVRKGKLKLNYVSGCEPELFDLENDPGEWTNIADDHGYRSRRDEMEKIALKDWDMERCDELRWQSEERRKAIMDSMNGASFGWQIKSVSPEHPLGYE